MAAKAAKAEDGIAVAIEQMAPKTEAEFTNFAKAVGEVLQKHSVILQTRERLADLCRSRNSMCMF